MFVFAVVFAARSFDVKATVVFVDAPSVLTFPFKAACVAVETGLSASAVLSTFPSPISVGVIFTSPVL